MKKTNRFFWLLVLVFLTGCSALTPKTYQLEQIHQNYTAEWAEWSLDALSEAKDRPEIKDGKGHFKKTLAGIKKYKQTYGDTSEAAAHLTVLEGMIYIQSGKPGMARLLSSEVKDAKEQLKSATGVASRDYLFAKCYDELTNGWEAIYQLVKNGASKEVDDFIGPADDISKELRSISKETRAAADLDSGGAYVAASAAIFYLWAHSTSPNDSNFSLKNMAKKGKDVLKPWLSYDEICSVEKGTYKKEEFDWGSRRRYLDWYDYLHEKSGNEAYDPSCP